MHEQFAKYGTPAIKLIEECSELITEIAKGERFGYDDKNPLIENSPTNRQRVLDEIYDVENALSKFKSWLSELPEDTKRMPEIEFEKEIPKEKYDFWCDKCKKRVTLETVKREEASAKMKENGWHVEIGMRSGMVVGVWTCPDCQKEKKRGQEL